MKAYRYSVMFKGGDLVEVITLGFTSAVIRACAERIKEGKHHEATVVTNLDTAEDWRIKDINVVFVAK